MTPAIAPAAPRTYRMPSGSRSCEPFRPARVVEARPLRVLGAEAQGGRKPADVVEQASAEPRGEAVDARAGAVAAGEAGAKKLAKLPARQ